MKASSASDFRTQVEPYSTYGERVESRSDGGFANICGFKLVDLVGDHDI
jgi:hypothetical protein